MAKPEMPSCLMSMLGTDAMQLVRLYLEEYDSLSDLEGFFAMVEDMNDQRKLFNHYGRLLHGKLPRPNCESSGMIDVTHTLEGRLVSHIGNASEVVVEDEGKEKCIPGDGDELVVSQALYDAVINNAKEVRKTLGGDIHYAVEVRAEAGCSCGFEYKGMGVWDPSGKCIYDGE